MTGFEIRTVPFSRVSLEEWARVDPRHRNWPTVYLIDDADRRRLGDLVDVYVGESHNVDGRLRQHLDTRTKQHLTSVHVVLDDTYNKSVCLDLESHLIRLLSGDGGYRVLNGNDGVIDAAYYRRQEYRESFREVFDVLRARGVFSRPIPEIENSDLYKLSPFKALTPDQAVAVEDIVEGLFADVESGATGTVAVEGGPGTGKTVIAVYLLKLLADIAASRPEDEIDRESMFAEFFTEEHAELLAGRRFGLVVPQQSLRATIQRVFARTPGLEEGQVVTPFEVGRSDDHWDLLIVDEAHRLNQRASLASGVQNAEFGAINTKLFGTDDLARTQLDWIRAKSARQILLVDVEQSVRPADLPPAVLRGVVDEAVARGRYYPLTSQMRVKAGEKYVEFVRSMLRHGGAEPDPGGPRRFAEYEFRLFDDAGEMHDEIRRLDAAHGLARLVAGYAWEWRSRKDPGAYDIELDGRAWRWNVAPKDWINSVGSLDQVGSIHTVQGYDLNYAGVVVGPDLRYDEAAGRLRFDRANYFDTKGKQNNPRLGIVYSDEDLLRYVANIYAVLMTRGMRGTFVYVCDPPLRRYLEQFIPRTGAGL